MKNERLDEKLYELGRKMSDMELESSFIDIPYIPASETVPAAKYRRLKIIVPNLAAAAAVLMIVILHPWKSPAPAEVPETVTTGMTEETNSTEEYIGSTDNEYVTDVTAPQTTTTTSTLEEGFQPAITTTKSTVNTTEPMPPDPENAIEMLYFTNYEKQFFNPSTRQIFDIASCLTGGQLLSSAGYRQKIYEINQRHAPGFVMKSSLLNLIRINVSENGVGLSYLYNSTSKSFVGSPFPHNAFISNHNRYYFIPQKSTPKIILTDMQTGETVDILDYNPDKPKMATVGGWRFSEADNYILYDSYHEQTDSVHNYAYVIGEKRTITLTEAGIASGRFLYNDRYVLVEKSPGSYRLYDPLTSRDLTGTITFADADRYIIVYDSRHRFFQRLDLQTMQMTHTMPLSEYYYNNDIPKMNQGDILRYWTDENNQLFLYKAGARVIEVIDIITMQEKQPLPLRNNDRIFLNQMITERNENPGLNLYHDEITGKYILFHF